MGCRLGPWLAALVAAVALAGPAAAANWGGITPGQTTRQEVEARYGRPTRERTVTEEGRTAAEWTYAGDAAPRGLERMVVGFGLLGPQGFRPDVVRALTLYARPRVFTLEVIASGWGVPDAIGTEQATGRSVFRYDARALLIVLDRTGQWAEVLLFAPEKPPASP